MKKSILKLKFFPLLALALLLLISGCSVAAQQPAAAETAPAATQAASVATPASGEDLTIPLDKISSKPAFFPVTENGKKMEVIALKASDGSIRTAFNTCQVCYSSGRGYYKVEGDTLVCQNCGNTFGFDEVDVTRGGCNPVPISAENRTQTDSAVVISANYLQAQSKLFENWK